MLKYFRFLKVKFFYRKIWRKCFVQNQNHGPNLPLTKVSQVTIFYAIVSLYFEIVSIFIQFSYFHFYFLLGQCSALEKLLKDFAGTYATGEHIYMV